MHYICADGGHKRYKMVLAQGRRQCNRAERCCHGIGAVVAVQHSCGALLWERARAGAAEVGLLWSDLFWRYSYYHRAKRALKLSAF